MRTFITYTVLVALLLNVLVLSNIADSLFVFLISGSIPGTPVALSPSVMMLLLAVIAWLVVARLASFTPSRLLAIHRAAKRHIKRSSTMPKRRYSRI
ncbi:MAG: hypothetical protein WAS27_00245 [Candidatus Saccharimonadales bacterium]